MEGGSLADWVSGIGSMLAVFVALFGYFLVEWQRRKDAREKIQGQIYQIGFKLSTFASEARTTMRDLNSKGLPLDKLLAQEDPQIIIGTQAPVLGYDRTMVRDLSDEEQNLLMLMREEEFLMNFSECVARNESVRSSFVDYGRRREEILERLPKVAAFKGQAGSYDISREEFTALMPYMVPASFLVRQARYLAHLNVEMITKLCDDFMPMMKRHYPKLHVHKIELIELPPGSKIGL